MDISSISPVTETDWLNIREQCCDFISRFGSRINQEGLRRLQNMPFHKIKEPSTSLIAATVRGEHGKMPVGICMVTGYGESDWLFAIHPLYRNQDIGPSLIRSQLSRLGYLCFKVPVNHYSSLRMCFDAGMHAVALESRPSSRPVLIMCAGSPGSAKTGNNSKTDSTQEGESSCLNLS
ncbi:hypothetical protein [Paenibacillus dakarensis]|uniref:hypothetical protein n=1 Tax=Paenibacillus dakarensis TaxID=1527293 RepID=UPI0006D58A92|nr:hypothetical protein [Paenibacillus dakarensis]